MFDYHAAVSLPDEV